MLKVRKRACLLYEIFKPCLIIAYGLTIGDGKNKQLGVTLSNFARKKFLNRHHRAKRVVACEIGDSKATVAQDGLNCVLSQRVSGWQCMFVKSPHTRFGISSYRGAIFIVGTVISDASYNCLIQLPLEHRARRQI